jgi:glycosyltransferase involved in cell wall biosynthesis
MGYDIYVIGRELPQSIPLKRAYETDRMKLLFNKGFLFYAEYNIRLFCKLLFLKKDMLLANDADTLLPNYFISRLFRKKLIFDSHELFSEIPELVNKPIVKRIWQLIEKSIIPNIKNGITVSESIANHYKQRYNSQFEVIRNIPYKESVERGEFPFNRGNKKIILYQGSVNVGRGLELMIDAMPLIENALFVIVGEGDITQQLKQKVEENKLAERVIFLGRIAPEKLQMLTPLADVGISLEEDLGLNYRYALPNKLFDYIQAQIPVIVSNLPEMRSVVEEYDIGVVLQKRIISNLAQQITKILQEGKEPWKDQLKKASEELNWQKESEKLKIMIQNLQ